MVSLASRISIRGHNWQHTWNIQAVRRLTRHEMPPARWRPDFQVQTTVTSRYDWQSALRVHKQQALKLSQGCLDHDKATLLLRIDSAVELPDGHDGGRGAPDWSPGCGLQQVASSIERIS